MPKTSELLVAHAGAGIPLEVASALIAGGFTLLAALIGFGALIIQISHQSESALSQQKEAERLKIKVGIYEKIIDELQGASNSLGMLLVKVALCRVSLTGAAGEDKEQLKQPNITAAQILEVEQRASQNLVDLTLLVERWIVIDRRLEVFKYAFGAVSHDLRNRFNSLFFGPGLQVLPHVLPNGQIHWERPREEVVEDFVAQAELLDEVIAEAGSYIADFQREIQVILMGDIFEDRIDPRSPVDPHKKVLRLDDSERLIRYFKSETEWGRKSEEAIKRAKAKIVAATDAQGRA